jgi:hypothetical protein
MSSSTVIQKKSPLNRKLNSTDRVLIAGWFSYPDRKATFGDVAAMDVICSWLDERSIPYDVAGNALNRVRGVDLHTVDPANYSFFVFVCGPWVFNRELLARFQHCVKIGINLSIEREGNGGFDYFFPRDRPGEQYPDLVFSASSATVPVVGIVLVHPQRIYGDRQRHHIVEKLVNELVSSGEIAPVYLDTLLDNNPGNLLYQSQFESVLKRTDVVISTRLHGMVYSLKNGIPVIAIDPVYGGAKIKAQAKAIDWPMVLAAEYLTLQGLKEAINHCLKNDITEKMKSSRELARIQNGEVKDRFLEIFRGDI